MPPDPDRLVALTGATGFIGRRLLPLLAEAGWRVRILARRDPAALEWGGLEIEVIQGDLNDAASLRRLVNGASAVLHLAGAIKAVSRQDFFRANADGTRRLARATAAIPGLPMLLVSSLAAREPGLSSYAASKRAAEEIAFDELGSSRLGVIRPPAVYGPGDRETLAFFKMARLPWLLLLAGKEARNALIHVDDLCRLLVMALEQAPSGRVQAVCDANPQGYSWSRIMNAAAAAQHLQSKSGVRAPIAMLRLAALVGDLERKLGRAQMLTSEKLRELLHPDWSVSEGERLQLPGWEPQYDLESGFVDAAKAYRKAGWLPRA